MKKPLLPKHYVLLIFILPALLAISYIVIQQQLLPVNGDDSKTIPVLDKPVSTKTPQQQIDEITDCAALLAVTESNMNGELKADSAMFNLISYALGKTRELEQQAGLAAGTAKASYDEKTVAYFMQQLAKPAETRARKKDEKTTLCEKMLREFEPGAQIQSTIDKAREMAKEAAHR